MDGLDVERIAAEQAPRERIVDMRLDRARAVERLAETDDPAVGMDADPEDIGEFLGPQGFDGGDFHRSLPGGALRRSLRSSRVRAWRLRLPSEATILPLVKYHNMFYGDD